MYYINLRKTRHSSTTKLKDGHVTIFGPQGVFIVSQARISTLHNSKRFGSLYSMLMPCILSMVWTLESLQPRSEMSITDLHKIQSSRQTEICEESIDSLT